VVRILGSSIKFYIIIPTKLIEQLGWKAGQELNADVKNDKLTIEQQDD
jgi:antitoxin component of MazEF toxin-antitoxin module